ncbi:MAG TPA: threonine--tRNA ligase, partial [Balneolaceae bacterium]|nr:threonine--tRNA ligase [Balneolaceae bacterium]
MADQKITLTLPDGTQREYSSGTTGLEVAQSIAAGLARAALSITVNGDIIDLDRPITKDAEIAINTWDSEDGKYTFWHSSAHLLAEAIQELYPNAKFGIGPPIESGFYYDIDFGDNQIGQEDLSKIEDKFIE